MNKSDALLINIQELKDKNTDIDVICITEHFMLAGYEQYLNIHNYTLASSFSRTGNKRGGSCILVKKEYKFRELPQINKRSINNVFECCAVELLDYKIVIICLYRIPKQSNLNLFFDRLDNVLKFISKISHNNIVIAGDFNIIMALLRCLKMQ